MIEGICPTCGQSLPNFVPAPLERCVHCGKPFDAKTKPQWLFTPNYVLRGRVHAKCSAKYDRHLCSGLPTPEEARRVVWGYKLSNTDVAHLFIEGRERLEELVAWWHEGPRQLNSEAIVKIRQALETAERQYREQFPEPLAEGGLNAS